MSEHDSETYNIGRLNQLYSEAESCDSGVFSEMRTNILLTSGQHYKKVSRGLDRQLQVLNVDKNKRLRLVKNHTGKAVSDIIDIMASMTPGVLPYPKLENERSSQKAAELAKSVWEDIKLKNHEDELKDEFRNCFVTTGEVASKVFFDPIAGGLKAYGQKQTELGQDVWQTPDGREVVLSDEMLMAGITPESQNLQPAPDKTKPIWKGKVTIEKIEPYNLLRPKNAQSIRSAKHLIVRKMVDLKDARALINASKLNDEEKKERHTWLEGSSKTTYQVFDGTSGSFQDSKGQVLFREFYFRQSSEFPRGYFFITCEQGILFQGELPFGEAGEVAFPIKHGRYHIYQGSCRGFSVIKRIRPCQVEINRAASMQAETQTTVGWDKLVTSTNAKVSRGADQPGMRHIKTSDPSYQIIPGRDGGQFVQTLEANVKELYELAHLPENNNPVAQATDPKAELFKKQSQKVRFTEPSNRLARFHKEVAETALFLASKYLSDDDMILAVGKTQAISIPEFKGVNRLDYQIKTMEVQDDIDSMLAKGIELETIVQYMGKNMDEQSSKMILTQFPVLNKARAFKHLTLDMENVNSDILALDRGQMRPAQPDDKHELYVEHLKHRQKEQDYEFLPENIKALYEEKLKQHQEYLVELARMQQEAEAGFIPSGGVLSKCDVYWNPDPNDPSKQQRLTLPSEAIMWLKKRLDAQGTTQDMLQKLGSDATSAQVAQSSVQNAQAPQLGADPTGSPFIPSAQPTNNQMIGA